MRLQLLLLPALASLLAACASSHLKVSIDLYDEDPRFTAPMTPEEAVQLREDVEKLAAAAKQKTQQRKYLATMGFNIYADTWKQAGGDKATVDALTGSYKGYIVSADAALNELEPPLAGARSKLDDYSKEYQQTYDSARTVFQNCENYRVGNQYRAGKEPIPAGCRVSEMTKTVDRLDEEWILRKMDASDPSLRVREAEARASVSKLAGAYSVFSSPTDSFIIDWVGLRARLNAALEIAQQRKMTNFQTQLERAIQSFNTRMASLAQTSNLFPRNDTSAGAIAGSAHPTKSGLLDSAVKIALELESLRTDLPDNVSAQTALAGLVRSSTQFLEQIDRLQDTGNPIWRTVTNPTNEEHWNKERAQTEFFAEGKSSVVMVRNDPMRFDVHEGTNNPTALIKGQLEITRAVADAAISVVGAATGFPTPKAPATVSNDNTNAATAQTATDGDTTTADAFAKRKAAADEQEKLRDRTMRSLSLELTSILTNLNTGGDAALPAQRAHLQAVLTAYESMFEASAK